MPIYDWNGTDHLEIGQVYDWDGTGHNQIGAVYDWNGTDHNLIYTAEEVLISGSTNTAGFTFTEVRKTSGGGESKWTCPTLYCSTEGGFTENYIEVTGKSYSGFSTLRLTGTLSYTIPYGQSSYDPFTKIYVNGTVKHSIVKDATGSDSTVHGTDTLDISIPVSGTVTSIKIHSYASWGSGKMDLTIAKLWLE